MTDRVLKVEGVECGYAGQRVLHGVDLSLAPGKITAVLGRSGCGKSTLMRAIAGFEPITGGRVALGDQLLSEAGFVLPPERRGIGIVVQSFALFPHLTIWKNVTFGAQEQQQHDLARHLLDQVGLADRLTAYPHELSGGEQQRIALIRALVPQPDVVLLDEAFSSLDRQMRESLRQEAANLLRESGAAVCAVTHDVDEALELADQLAIMREGRIVQQGTGEEVFWRPRDAEIGRLLGSLNIIEGVKTGAGIQTPFGTFQGAENMPDGHVQILLRPAAIALDKVSASDDAVRIVAQEFRGQVSTHTLAASNGATLIASAHHDAELQIGESVAVRFDMKRAQVQPAA